MALKGLLNSRKGLFALLLIGTATAFVVMKIMEINAWADYTKAIFTVFVGGHAIQETASTIANRPKSPSTSGVTSGTVIVNQPTTTEGK